MRTEGSHVPGFLDDSDLCVCGHVKEEHDGLGECTMSHHEPPCGCKGYEYDGEEADDDDDF